MKRVSMMLLVLLAMSVQAAKTPKDHKKKKAAKKTALQKYRQPTTYEIKNLLLFIASKEPGDNKCTWKGIKTGQGSVKLDTVHEADTQFFKHGKNMRFQHLIGTSNKDGPRRSCIIWVGGNRNLFKLKKGGKIPRGPQSGAISKKLGKSPRMWRYSNTLSGWKLNHVAAHVEIQTRKKKNSGWVWESQGNWLIPTTRSSNSRAGKTCKNGKNQNKWETLRDGVSVTAIKLPHDGNSC